jgi:hypothetical protein
MHPRPALPAAIITTLALALAGCGSSTSSTTSSNTAANSPANTTTAASTATTTAAASVLPSGFSQAAEAICVKRNKAIDAVGLSVETEQAFKRIAHGRAAVEHKTLGELQKLTPPTTIHAEWGQFLSARQALVTAWNQVSEHGLINHAAKGSAEYRLTSVTTTQNKMLTAAKHLNLTNCTHEN